GLSDHFIFAGLVPPADVPRYVGIMNALVHLSLREGLPRALPQALAAERTRFPPVYRAVVESGLKAGRLSVALEGLANFARNFAEMRRAIGMAMVYPLVILTIAYGLFVFLVLVILPRFLATYSFFRLPGDRILVVLARLRETLPLWGPVVPVALVLVGVWWIQSGRAMLVQSAWARRTLGWLPWVRGMITNSQAACFAELLSLLVEQEVPLHESIRLSAQATGDEDMIEQAGELAASAQRGDSVPVALRTATVFPPMLRWLMVTGLERGMLASALRHAAETYRELSLHQASLVKQLLPVALLLAIGATATFLYCMSVFVPLTELLYELSAP
ncbi:MAG: type II secretion system F family protein, partial [Planctomycetes bacterium]|nr:type II secretion system F family protein [Planctomycetota bacterium]